MSEIAMLEDAADIAAYDAAKARFLKDGGEALPADVSAFMLKGASLLTALRKRRGLSQIELASKASLSQGYLSDLETGRRRGGARTLDALARALDAPRAWFAPSD